mmetsp:Transcript_10830/g.28878  ORF Transcript_10830/g.28878 Transcript_10830/m.28878 type:complete len:85 (+) Transcript_10830:3328-3582(+)
MLRPPRKLSLDARGAKVSSPNHHHHHPGHPQAQCIEWKTTYTVEPGISWGSLPFDLQNKWKLYDCDKWIGAGAAAGGSSFGGLY